MVISSESLRHYQPIQPQAELKTAELEFELETTISKLGDLRMESVLLAQSRNGAFNEKISDKASFILDHIKKMQQQGYSPREIYNYAKDSLNQLNNEKEAFQESKANFEAKAEAFSQQCNRVNEKLNSSDLPFTPRFSSKRPSAPLSPQKMWLTNGLLGDGVILTGNETSLERDAILLRHQLEELAPIGRAVNGIIEYGCKSTTVTEKACKAVGEVFNYAATALFEQFPSTKQALDPLLKTPHHIEQTYGIPSETTENAIAGALLLIPLPKIKACKTLIKTEAIKKTAVSFVKEDSRVVPSLTNKNPSLKKTEKTFESVIEERNIRLEKNNINSEFDLLIQPSENKLSIWVESLHVIESDGYPAIYGKGTKTTGHTKLALQKIMEIAKEYKTKDVTLQWMIGNDQLIEIAMKTNRLQYLGEKSSFVPKYSTGFRANEKHPIFKLNFPKNESNVPRNTFFKEPKIPTSKIGSLKALTVVAAFKTNDENSLPGKTFKELYREVSGAPLQSIQRNQLLNGPSGLMDAAFYKGCALGELQRKAIGRLPYVDIKDITNKAVGGFDERVNSINHTLNKISLPHSINAERFFTTVDAFIRDPGPLSYAFGGGQFVWNPLRKCPLGFIDAKSVTNSVTYSTVGEPIALANKEYHDLLRAFDAEGLVSGLTPTETSLLKRAFSQGFAAEYEGLRTSAASRFFDLNSSLDTIEALAVDLSKSNSSEMRILLQRQLNELDKKF